MSSQSPITAPAFVAIVTLATAGLMAGSARAQAIVKWTDESGHVHYSDHAPAGHTAVSNVAVPKSSAGIGATAVTSNDAINQNQVQPVNNAGLASEYDVEQSAAAADRVRKQQREQQQQAAQAARKKADQAVIDRCKADHEPNCSDGAAAIRQRSHMAAEEQCTTPAGCRNVEQLWQDSQNSGN